jgi:glyoxylase-like metal-dependent hydrolase (beta-lactamase superfamily II)
MTAEIEVGGADVVQVRRNGKGCLSYVVGAEGEAIVVDPSFAIEQYVEIAHGHDWQIIGVLDTHLHADHLSGARALAAATGARLYLNPIEGYGFPHESVQRMRFALGGNPHAVVTVLQVPGHTHGSIAVDIAGQVLLSGDSLFVDGVGRPDLADRVEEDAALLHQSLHQGILSLPDEMLILPAHHGARAKVDAHRLVTAPLGDIRASIPALALEQASFVDWTRSVTTARPANYRRIVDLNIAGELSLDAEMLQLELAPNRCAL